jgi:hypothetical protein
MKTIETRVICSEMWEDYTHIDISDGKKDIVFQLPMAYNLQAGDRLKFYNCKVHEDNGHFWITNKDYEKLEFIRKGKKNVELRVYGFQMEKFERLAFKKREEDYKKTKKKK